MVCIMWGFFSSGAGRRVVLPLSVHVDCCLRMSCSEAVRCDPFLSRAGLEARELLAWIIDKFSSFWGVASPFFPPSLRQVEVVELCLVEGLPGFQSGSGGCISEDFLEGDLLLGVLQVADPSLGDFLSSKVGRGNGTCHWEPLGWCGFEAS